MLVCLAVQLLTREGEAQEDGPRHINGFSRVFGNADVCRAFACRTAIPHVVPSVQQMQRRQWVELWFHVRQVPLFRQLAESTEESAIVLDQWKGGTGDVESNDDVELQFKHLSIQEALVALVLSHGGLPEFWGCNANARREVTRQRDGCSTLKRGWFRLTKRGNWGCGLQVTRQVMSITKKQLNSGMWQNVLRIGGPDLGNLLASVVERFTSSSGLTPTGLASLAECHSFSEVCRMSEMTYSYTQLGEGSDDTSVWV